jgi:hypothetical protein
MYGEFSHTPSTTVEHGRTTNAVAVAHVLAQGKGNVCH